MLCIQPDECVDCGAGEPVRPVEAIFFEDGTPQDWQHFTTVNADFFAELGPTGRDHPIVAALPSQGAVTSTPAVPQGI